MRLYYIFCITSVSACWKSFDDAISDTSDVLELLTLTKFFFRDTKAYGEQLVDDIQDVYIDALDRFTQTESDETVNWWQGISTEDLLDTKDDLIQALYQLYRYCDRLVDYMDDISSTSCRIGVINSTIVTYVDPIIEPLTNQNITIGSWNIEIASFSMSPCAFDDVALMQRVAIFTDAADWIDTQFEFFELFWKVYGSLITIN